MDIDRIAGDVPRRRVTGVVFPLHISPPHRIPSREAIDAWAERHHRQRLLPMFDGALPLTPRVVGGAIARVLGQLPTGAAARAVDDMEPDDQAHDAYFQVARVSDHEPPVLVRSALLARWIFLTEVGEGAVSLSTSTLDTIDRALGLYAAALHGDDYEHLLSVDVWRTSGEAPRPMTRWIRGHQVFAVLTQGLIFAFQCLARALREGRESRVRRWADLATALLLGSAATFRFTGDFPPDAYDTVIRPSMAPPQAPVSLSGLMSWDHRYFAQALRELRPTLKALADRDPARHQALADAIAEVYDSHIHVCERFVGEQPSLLTAGRTERSGSVLLENFKALRLKPFAQTANPRRCPVETKAPVINRPPDPSK